MMETPKCIIFLLGLIGIVSAICPINQQGTEHWCRDQNGQKVDWWILYKKHGERLYYYQTSHAQGNQRGLSINHPNDSLLGCTTLLLASSPNAVPVPDYFSFNDDKTNPRGTDYGFNQNTTVKFDEENCNDVETSTSVNSCFAHAKGLLVSDERSGFWITHTVPDLHFRHNQQRTYPNTQTPENGQSAICVSLGTDQHLKLHLLNRMCQMNVQLVHGSNRGTELGGHLIRHSEWGLCPSRLNDDYIDFAFRDVQQAHTRIRFRSRRNYPKKAGEVEEFWRQLAINWTAHITLQTWQPNIGTKPSSPLTPEPESQLLVNSQCNLYQQPFMAVPYPCTWSKKDHSKVAELHYIENGVRMLAYCVGDLNRATTQIPRGGGVVCVEKPEALWVNFLQLQQFRHQRCLIEFGCV